MVASSGAITGDTRGSGPAGTVTIVAGSLSIAGNGAISSNTFGPGSGGRVSVTVDGQLTITGTSSGGVTGIASDAEQGKTGNAGNVAVGAGTLTIQNNGEISVCTFGTGNGGSVSVCVPGALTIDSSGGIF